MSITVIKPLTGNDGVVPPFAGGSPVPGHEDEHWGLEVIPEPDTQLPPIPIMPDPNTPIIMEPVRDSEDN